MLYPKIHRTRKGGLDYQWRSTRTGFRFGTNSFRRWLLYLFTTIAFFVCFIVCQSADAQLIRRTGLLARISQAGCGGGAMAASCGGAMSSSCGGGQSFSAGCGGGSSYLRVATSSCGGQSSAAYYVAPAAVRMASNGYHAHRTTDGRTIIHSDSNHGNAAAHAGVAWPWYKAPMPSVYSRVRVPSTPPPVYRYSVPRSNCPPGMICPTSVIVPDTIQVTSDHPSPFIREEQYVSFEEPQTTI